MEKVYAHREPGVELERCSVMIVRNMSVKNIINIGV